MNKTNIEYLDYTWNPLAMRCRAVSEGCAHCWHLGMADRLIENPMIKSTERDAYAGHDTPIIREKEIKKPIATKVPGRIGVQFMGDLFYEGVGFDQIHRIFDVMWRAERHTFLVLTKRPERMFEFMTQKGITGMYGNEWPLRNVWLGVTAENQARADERIPILLQIPAAVRFVSVEPMLGPVDLRRYLWSASIPCCHCGKVFEAWQADLCNGHHDTPFGPLEERRTLACPHCNGCACIKSLAWEIREAEGNHCIEPSRGRFEWQKSGLNWHNPISWVICGGESGPGARPMHPDWARSLRDQCQAAEVPFMFKQWGEWIGGKFDRAKGKMICDPSTPGEQIGRIFWTNPGQPKVQLWEPADHYWHHASAKVGKKAAGRELDGQVWDQYPEVICIK